MKNTIYGVAGFVVGAAAGSLVTWRLIKAKYAQISREEIESVKEEFKAYRMPEAAEPLTEEEDSEDQEVENTDFLKKSVDISEQMDYTAYSKPEKEENVVVTKDVKRVESDPERPYVITPEEFGEFADYEQLDLTFYRDHILADDGNEIVEDIDELIGFESLNHFGEYSEDVVYVRNDKHKCDYEVNLDSRTYEESLASRHARKGVL